MVETKLESATSQFEKVTSSSSKIKSQEPSSSVKGWTKFYTLNNGAKFPALGFGTWKSKKDEVYDAVKCALKNGYRHLDCAEAYGNQDQVGKAIRDAMKEYNIKREELWVTSKLWITCFEPKHGKEALNKTLADLQLDYLDLYLLHWPVALEYDENDVLSTPKDEKGMLKIAKIPLYKTWQQMEEFVQQGLVRSIGISNFEPSNIYDMLSYAKIKPVVNQVEFHPYFQRKELQSICEHYQILITAYSPFGNGLKEMFDDPTLVKIADKYKKTAGQIIIRWLLQLGVSAIPKSVHEERITQNLDIFDFKLSDDEMKAIADLDRHLRTCDTRREDYWNVPFNDV